MRTRISKELAIASGVTVAAVALLACLRLATHPFTDQGRYGELCRLGRRYKAAWTGKPQFLERMAAVLHFTSLTNYYRSRLDADSKALLASGYFVQISVPVPDLKGRIPRVCNTLLQTAQNTGAYYEAKLYWPGNEVRLVCRKEDVRVWEQALSKVPE